MKKAIRITSLIVISAVLLIIYMIFIEPTLLRINQVKLSYSTLEHATQAKFDTDNNLKIIQFTDTHLGPFYSLQDLHRVVVLINKQQPDLVFFTGDLMDIPSAFPNKEGVIKELEQIKSRFGKFAVWGNRDYGGGGARTYADLMEQSGFELLMNNHVYLNIKGTNIGIFGGDDAMMGSPDSLVTVEGIDPTALNLLLIHQPDPIVDYKDMPIDFAFSGHSHGGQIALPFYGALKRNVLSEDYNKGLYNLETLRNTQLFVSSGLGNTRLPFRFLNIPEICVFNIPLPYSN